MKCPVCGKEIVEERYRGVKAHVCKDGCRGIWLSSRFELNKLVIRAAERLG